MHNIDAKEVALSTNNMRADNTLHKLRRRWRRRRWRRRWWWCPNDLPHKPLPDDNLLH